MTGWIYDHGTWRWRSPAGVYFRITFTGGKYRAVINRSQGFPCHVGSFASLGEAKAACMESQHERRADECTPTSA